MYSFRFYVEGRSASFWSPKVSLPEIPTTFHHRWMFGSIVVGVPADDIRTFEESSRLSRRSAVRNKQRLTLNNCGVLTTQIIFLRILCVECENYFQSINVHGDHGVQQQHNDWRTGTNYTICNNNTRITTL